MTYTGRVENGVVVFDGPDHPPDGQVVEVQPVKSVQGPTWGEVFGDLIGAVEGLPSDLARNHDHYIHGAPKR